MAVADPARETPPDKHDPAALGIARHQIAVGDHVGIVGYGLYGRVKKLFDGDACTEHNGQPAVAILDCGGIFRNYAALVDELKPVAALSGFKPLGRS